MKLGRFVLRGAFPLLVCVAFFATASASRATVLEGYFLEQPCCGGDSLYGTRASIRTPNSQPSHGGDECMLFRSDAEGFNSSGIGRLIQAGFVHCGPSTSLDGTCATVNKQVQFVEIL